MSLNDIQVYVFPKDVYYAEYLEDISNLAETSMEVTEYSENNINGIYENDEEELFFFAIPYNRNWHLYVDGKETIIKWVNIGFMGAGISAGKHEITLKYKAETNYFQYSAVGGILCVLYMV